MRFLKYVIFYSILGGAATACELVCPGGCSIGFEELHRMGYQGKNQKIVIFEPGIQFESSHPAFNGRNIKCIDTGRTPQFSTGFEDQSEIRYTNLPENSRIEFWSFSDHAQQITSILIGVPSPENKFPEGIIPQSNISLVSFSHARTYESREWILSFNKFSSTAVYPFEGSGFIDESNREDMKNYFTLKGLDIQKLKIDDSIYDALKIAFQSEARVIMGSFNLQSPTDFKNCHRLTPDFLDFLATNLQKQDQILLFSAGNYAHDISESNRKGLELWDKNVSASIPYFIRRQFLDEVAEHLSQISFEQYAEHPILKERVLIVVNAILFSKETNLERGRCNVELSNGKVYDIALAVNSSYPGSNPNLQAITVGAFGSNVTVAKENGQFKSESGTSLAVPMAGGLLTLIDEHYEKKGKNLSGPDLLKILKKTSVLPNEDLRNYYGNGLINPLGFLQ